MEKKISNPNIHVDIRIDNTNQPIIVKIGGQSTGWLNKIFNALIAKWEKEDGLGKDDQER